MSQPVGRSWVWSVMLVSGLVLGWVGERVVDSGTARAAWSGLGLGLVLLAVGARTWRRSKSKGDRRPIEASLLGLNGALVGALLLYFVQSDLWAKLAGHTLETGWPKLAGCVSALWPALLVASLLPTLLVEMSYAAMARAPALETARIREAMWSGLALAFAVTFCFSLQYVVSERDAKADFSYFRMAKPGDATKRLVQSLDEKLEIYLFFAPANDVGEYIDLYFDELKQGAPMLTVTRLDHALEPVKAQKLGVSGNGTVLFKKADKKESLYVGVELDKSRTQLRGLDGEVMKHLLQIGKSRRTVYMTAGHGERTQDVTGGTDQRATIELLWKALQDQNFEVRTLSTAEGLAQEIPRDATAVFVVGPRESFSVPEAAAIEAYAKRGGKLFFALDPEAGKTFEELLTPLGLSFKPEVLCNDKVYARLKREYSLADRRNIGTRSFSSHPSVTYLARYQAPVLLVGAGPLEELKAHPADLSLDFPVRADAATWNDVNNNFEPDSPPEVRKAYGLVAAVNRRAPSNKIEDELRALVVSDSDGIADEILPAVQGNQYLVVDGLKWLLGEEQLQGAVSSENDVPLTRSRHQESLWFFGTTVVAPVLVLGAGLIARRRVKPAKKEAKP